MILTANWPTSCHTVQFDVILAVPRQSQVYTMGTERDQGLAADPHCSQDQTCVSLTSSKDEYSFILPFQNS